MVISAIIAQDVRVKPPLGLLAIVFVPIHAGVVILVRGVQKTNLTLINLMVFYNK
jgi:hypothetical protein